MSSLLTLTEHLSRQRGYLQNSCDNFDKGHADEAIRIATSVRVLLHSSGSGSSSLIDQLNLIGIQLLSTYAAMVEGSFTLVPWNRFSIGEDGVPSVSAHLGSGNINEYINLNNWWNDTIFRASASSSSRRTIVLGAVNKDGGAHVDIAKVPAHYRDISMTGITSSYSKDGEIVEDFYHHHYIILRQIGYELLNSPDLWAICT
jgi:hypothetical protein